jgi:hypothetical protein
MLLLQEENPYGSRIAVVEDDGQTVYLYLMTGPPDDPQRQLFPVWVANRGPAPESEDVAAMREGNAPRMPSRGTRSPDGLPPFHRENLELVWFEEGDGVALLERGQPLAVAPGWIGYQGFPGYAREAVGDQLLAWELGPALESLRPRIEAARRYWKWRSTEESWLEIQGAGINHLEARLGPRQR